MMDKKQSRRDFLRMVAISTAASAIEWSRVEALGHTMKARENFPVVVVGAGLGGLTAAAYLSKAGFPVTVVERHSIPGGYATSFTRGRFEFDVSLHATSVNNNPIYEIYRELGLLKKLELVPLHQSHRLLSDKKDIILPDQDPNGFIELLASNYPKEREGIKGFVKEVVAVSDETYNLFKKKGKFVKMTFPVQYPRIWSLRNRTLAEVLQRHVKGQEARSALSFLCGYYGLPPSRLSGFYYATATGEFLKNGSFYIKPRSQRLSNALAEVITENGGTVLTGVAAEKIMTADGKVRGVRAEDGKIYPARIVVSNANVPDTFTKLLDGCDCAAFKEKISRYKTSISSFVVFLGLKGELRGKIPGCSIFISEGKGDIEKKFSYIFKGDVEHGGFGVGIYDNCFDGYSAPGTSTVTLTFMTGFEPWRRFERDYFAGKKKEYHKEKTRVADILIRRAEERLIPGLRSMIQVQDAATPLTNITYTGNPNGAVYGYEQVLENAPPLTRLPNRTPVKGLYLSSAWGFPGGGYTGVMRAGEETFRLIVDDLAKL